MKETQESSRQAGLLLKNKMPFVLVFVLDSFSDGDVYCQIFVISEL